MQKGSKFCHELTIECSKGGEIIYGQVWGFFLCIAAFSTECVLQAGVQAGVVTQGSRVVLDGIVEISSRCRLLRLLNCLQACN